MSYWSILNCFYVLILTELIFLTLFKKYHNEDKITTNT
jgi:hypothetical protein